MSDECIEVLDGEHLFVMFKDGVSRCLMCKKEEKEHITKKR